MGSRDVETLSQQSFSSKISTDSMIGILNRLKCQSTRGTTAKKYLNIWRLFNNFVIKLDYRPPTWEERISLFAAYIIDRGVQSANFEIILFSYKSYP